MIWIENTRGYLGYSRYGDPFVASFSLGVQPIPLFDQDLPRVQARLCELGLTTRDSRVEIRGGCIPPVVPLFAGVTLELLRLAGHEPEDALAEEMAGLSRAAVAIRCEELQSCFYAGELASELLRAIVAGKDAECARSALDDYLLFARNRSVDPNSRVIMREARRRRLPVRWLDQAPFVEAPEDRVTRFGLIQIGQGREGHILVGPMPRVRDTELLLKVSNRSLLMPLLARSGIPIPRQDLEFPNKSTVARALRAASRIGYPVAVKSLFKQEFPYRQPMIRVYGPLNSPEQVAQAFEGAAQGTRQVWVEGHAPGRRYRFLVIGGRVRAVAECRPPYVRGDGRSTVAELVSARVRDAATLPVRAGWTRILAGDPDVELRLRLAGHSFASVLPEGAVVELRGECSSFNGGECEDVTDLVSGPIRALAERAAHCCKLKQLAGVDIAIGDPAGSAIPDNCAVVDVLPDPDLLMHMYPVRGEPRDVAADLVDHLFPPGSTGRIPLVAVTGTNGKTTTTRMIAHILRSTYEHVGVSTTAGAMVDRESIREGDVAGVAGVASILAVERTDAAVVETARGGLIKAGSGFDVCDVGVCLNVTADHLGADGVETLEQMASVKSDVIRRARCAVVLNADDERVLAMRGVAVAPKIVLVSQGRRGPDLVAQGGTNARAVVIEQVAEEPWIVAYDHRTRIEVMPVASIPATLLGGVSFNVENASFAVAASVAMGLPIERTREAMKTFGADYDSNPGRFNVIDSLPFRVVIDYAHNAEGMRRLCQALEALPRARRRVLLLRVPGPRSEQEIHEVAREAAAQAFDLYVCSRRGKAWGAVPELLRRTLLQQGIPEKSVKLIEDPEEGIEYSLGVAEPGDLVVLLGGKRAGMIREALHRRSLEAVS